MDEIKQPNVDEIINCPKCGFQQPQDQYCAKCGVDMFKAARSRAKVSPIMIGVIGLSAIGLGALSYGQFFSTSEKNSSRLASIEQGDDEATIARNAAPVSSPSQQSLSQQSLSQQNQSSQSLGDTSESRNSDSASQVSQRQIEGQAAVEAQGARGAQLKASASGPVVTPPSKSSASTPKKPEVLVAFAWAEMSRELLASFQAAEPGFHKVSNLESRLRQARGGYRILDVTRRRLQDDSETVSLNRNDINFYFEPIRVQAEQLTGGFTSDYRNSQGEVRAPAAATATLVRGNGAIVTLSPAASMAAGAPASSPGSEIVVVILPRWEK